MRSRLSTQTTNTLINARAFGIDGFQYSLDFKIETSSVNEFTREMMTITRIGYGESHKIHMINERERHIPRDDELSCRGTWVVFAWDELRRAMGEDRNEAINNALALFTHAKDWEAIFQDLRQMTLDAIVNDIPPKGWAHL